MSIRSNNYGRAYEYICLITFQNEIAKHRLAKIIKNNSFKVAKRAWSNIAKDTKRIFRKSAYAIVDTIFNLEPNILEDANDTLELSLQQDLDGKNGDVRDIVIFRQNIKWEIGISVKHNHFAVKHSRIGKDLDFCKKWFNVACSKQYWNDVKPIFAYLEKEKAKQTKWRDIVTKETSVYVPLLTAFLNEIKRKVKDNKDITQKMVEYLLGKFDFYKIISIDNKKITQVSSFNIHGFLNQPTNKNRQPKIKVPMVKLPNRIVSMDFKPNSTNTIELYMNEGWQFNFRIHNASTIVENSLKFDIQVVSMPISIVQINCKWQ